MKPKKNIKNIILTKQKLFNLPKNKLASENFSFFINERSTSLEKLYNSDNNIFIKKNKGNFSTSMENLHYSNLIHNIKNTLHYLRNQKNYEKKKQLSISPKNYLNPNVRSIHLNAINFYINSNSNFFEKFNNFLKLIMKTELEIEQEKINFVSKININFKIIYKCNSSFSKKL